MDSYKIILQPSFEEELRAIPFPARRQINHRIIRLKWDRRGAEAAADESAFQLRMYGWRIFFDVDDAAKTVTILAIRKD